MNRRNGGFLAGGAVLMALAASTVFSPGEFGMGLGFAALALGLLAVYFVRELRSSDIRKPSLAALIVGCLFLIMGLSDLGGDPYGVALGFGVGLPLLAAWLLRVLRRGKNPAPQATPARAAAEPPLKTCPHCGAPGRGSVCEYCGGPM